jgi:secreted PhoX family phosphatase
MIEYSQFDRRTFLRRGAMGAGALWAASLGPFMARRAEGAALPSPYGDIFPTADEVTGLELLKLPSGFRYRSYSWTGDVMADDVRCPNLHDGMAVVDAQGNSGRIILVRNHEGAAGAPYLNKPSITYRTDAAGGTTNLIFNLRRGTWEKDWSTLAGTNRNCAGGVTPWGTWITGEETGDSGHGWAFDVGPQKGDPTPLKAMGRFSHEAMMVDPYSGYVYETEDATPSGFYRFVPNVPGQLAQGGQLYMLKALDSPMSNDFGPLGVVGQSWNVEWVPINDPEATTMSTVQQGIVQDGAKFRRLEGCWWGDTKGYFLSTNGGPVSEGQVYEYDPINETLELIYASPTANDLDNPDNITVTPRGGLLLCEDAAGGTNIVGERLVGLTLNGNTFTFAQNNIVLTAQQIAIAGKTVTPNDYRGQEFAGACYSPDGEWLFVNIQTPGITFAITGPWGGGPL